MSPTTTTPAPSSTAATTEPLRIAVFGLGYVGAVSAACFADLGHHVIGVDVNADKVERINAGRSPVLEPGVPERLEAAVAAGRIRATTDPVEAVRASDLSLLCVGTPSHNNGDIDLRYIEGVAAQIGDALADSDQGRHVIVIRSTVLPGTAARVATIVADRSGRTLGQGFSVAVNPEFLREGTGVADFNDPPLILVGADTDEIGEMVLRLYDGIGADRFVEPVRLTEMVKYANNSFHATKVTFANEIGAVSRSLGIDGTRVMELLCHDDKLNISPAYLRPGFAFGGSCLPKDVRALNFAAKSADVVVPLLSSLLTSNDVQVSRVIDETVAVTDRRVGVVGLAFKEGTDDLRESPVVEVLERLIGKGFDCRIFDPDVSAPDLIGGNRAFIEREIPHLTRWMSPSLDELIAHAETLIVSKRIDGLAAALARRPADQLLIDLVGLPAEARGGRYLGVAW